MGSVLIVGAILGYAGFVVYKKVSAIKKGNYCSCSGCDHCPSSGKCNSTKNEKENK